MPIYCGRALGAFKVSTQQAPLAIEPLSLSARDIDGGASLEPGDPSWLILTNISHNHANVSQYYSTCEVIAKLLKLIAIMEMVSRIITVQKRLI